MSSADVPLRALPRWCLTACRFCLRFVDHPRRGPYLAAATVPLLLLLWPWGVFVPAGGGRAASAGPLPAASASAAPSDEAPAQQVEPDHRQRLATLKGALPAADQVPLVTTYTVATGDTLTSVASRFGTDVASLEKTNGLTDYSVLKVGQTLTVLRRVGWLYTVASGDTVSSIATAAGVTAPDLVAANGLIGPNPVLQSGEQLVIPKDPTVVQPAAPAESGGAAGASSGLIWPVHGLITSPFGWRPDPWTDSGHFFHDGLDIAVPRWTHVAAACSGRVVLAGWDGGYGEAVEIACDDGLLTLYGHNTQVAVRYGERVNQGDLVSYSGMTGNATGPHVHFGVMRGGVWQNPLYYLP